MVFLLKAEIKAGHFNVILKTLLLFLREGWHKSFSIRFFSRITHVPEKLMQARKNVF